jgi:hypothetical protein
VRWTYRWQRPTIMHTGTERYFTGIRKQTADEGQFRILHLARTDNHYSATSCFYSEWFNR